MVANFTGIAEGPLHEVCETVMATDAHMLSYELPAF
jgi:hypothetical protein